MDFFYDPDHPPLEKAPKDDGYPRRETWVESHESIVNYPILSDVDKCTVIEPANAVIRRL